MPISRIYQPISLSVNTTVRLDAKASHHIAHVLRAKRGDKVILFNGYGGEYVAEISTIDKKGVELNILSFTPREVESSVDICLAQGIARGEKMDFIIQKAVELGVKKIIPLLTERCNVRLSSERSEKRSSHWQSIVQGACEQSGRNQVPTIEAPMLLSEWLACAKADLSFVLTPHVQASFPSLASAPKTVQILIGPEGGLTNLEVQSASEHGFLPLIFGPRILRTETATVVAISVLQFKYGDM